MTINESIRVRIGLVSYKLAKQKWKGTQKYIIQTTHKFKFKELRSIHSENHKNWTWLLVDVNAVNSFHNAYYYFITTANLLTNKGQTVSQTNNIQLVENSGDSVAAETLKPLQGVDRIYSKPTRDSNRFKDNAVTS